jgi:hypothetical protein
MDLPDAPVPEEGFLVTHFLTVEDQARSRAFYAEVLDNHGWETRCYMRDPDGYIIEVGQPSEKMIALFGARGRAQG